MSRKYIIICFILFIKQAVGHNNITGYVMESSGLKEVTIPGASILTLDGSAGTVTDGNGFFSLEVHVDLPVTITAGFIGFITDTIIVSNTSPVKIILRKSIDLKEVEVSSRKQAVTVSTINPINSEKITERELLKAACCNLSEAFETNPSVNVAYKDAVTGVKEIQLLGLGGTYVQLLSENIPDMRGLAGIYGLTFIPGPWIESIQVTKGSGSVLNGYESTTGQINIEYKKPHEKEVPSLYINLFGEDNGATEANIILKKKISKYWGTMLFLHGRRFKNEEDRNNDGFRDAPENSSINIYNRWQYHNTEKLEGQVSVKFLADEVEGGQMSDLNVNQIYRTRVETKRVQVAGKLGILFPEKPSKSIGNIFQATVHDMKSVFGLKSYNATESSIYVQSIYQNVIGNISHQYKTGITYRYNLLEQHFEDLPGRIEEHIPGVFLEYTWNPNEKLTVILGAREDLQNNKNWEFIPRLHAKYNFSENFIVRVSGGKSYRTPYLIADHISVLASSRQINVLENILPERAWNYGMNFTKRFKFGEHENTFSVDAYRTDFINQLVVDAYSDSTKISYYNLNGKSFSNSLQFTLNLEIIDLLNLRLAYKVDDVRSTFNGKEEEMPLVTKNRALGTLSFATSNEHWKFDYTTVWEGSKKLQNVYSDYNNNGKSFSPSFFIINLQVTKVFKRFEIYGGTENLTDFRQTNPIINPDNPFGNSFDATNIWGPIQGRRIYLGVRITPNVGSW